MSIVTGCGDPEGGTAAPSGGGKTLPVRPLPIEKYLVDTSQEKQLLQASKVLIAQCMKRFGFDYTGPDFETTGTQHSSAANRERRYGVADLQTAKSNGYHLPAPSGTSKGPTAPAQEMSEAEDRVFIGDADPASGVHKGDKVNGTPIPAGGCSGEARRELGTDTEHALANEINTKSYVKSLADPDVKSLFDSWASCMKKKGYRYASPPDAADSASGEKADRKEIALAVADVECKKDVDLLGAWHDVESRIQEKMISEHEEALVAEKKHMSTSLGVAAKVLENSR
ncbi:hypothetical protein AB0B21_34770 [Streptomyces rimosus]|uniref:hypothetical protein n=1 Tax=Streptomyces rimosus TaxID=1927 RepID=UPI00131EC5D7|nr:hypothetical protein [Streptomyces rimosus]